MKAKKRVAVFGSVLLGLAGLLLVGKLGGCRPPDFDGGGFCAGFRDRGCPPGFPGKGFADHVFARLDRHVEELNLSDDQKKSYEGIRASLKENMDEGKAGRQGLFNDVRSEMAKEKPDMDQISGIIKQHMKKFPEHIEKNLDLFITFYGILDENQQKQVVEMMRERMKRGPS